MIQSYCQSALHVLGFPLGSGVGDTGPVAPAAAPTAAPTVAPTVAPTAAAGRWTRPGHPVQITSFDPAKDTLILQVDGLPTRIAIRGLARRSGYSVLVDGLSVAEVTSKQHLTLDHVVLMSG